MDAAASIITIIQLAQSVGGALKDYYEGVRDAREDIERLYHSIKNLEYVFEAIKALPPQTLSSHLRNLLTDEKRPLDLCKLELVRLQEKLGHSSASKRLRMLEKLVWPFKKGGVEKIVSEIDRHKHDLTLEFAIDNLHFSIGNHEILKDIQSDILAAKQDKVRREIIDWLVRSLPDPSQEHNIARKKFQKGTGSWLVDGDELKTWSSTPNSFMWLNAGAGAGKSILCSTIIDHVQKQCKAEPNAAVSYWYIRYDDAESKSINNLLRSWIRDICSNRQDTPQVLIDVYTLCNHGQQHPTEEQVMEMLKAVMAGFEHIYLIVDALDEYPKADRESLLDTIMLVKRWKIDSTHIFVTSRGEDDIRNALTSFKAQEGLFQNIKAHDPQIKEDIKRFVTENLDTLKFKRWTPALKREVTEGIAEQADYMFRLAALQLDSLKPSRTEPALRKALKTLPTSLDIFYERALEDIPESDQYYVKTALQWIAYTVRPISVRELSEAVIVQPDVPDGTPYLDEHSRLECDGTFDLLDMIPSAFITTYEADDDDSYSLSDGYPGTGRDSYFGCDPGALSKESVENEEIHPDDTASNLHAINNDPEDDESIDSEIDASIASSPESYRTRQIQQHYRSVIHYRSLIRLKMRFAHFSVLEYLQSSRINNKVTEQYHIEKKEALNSITNICIAYLLHIGASTKAHSMMQVRLPLEYVLLDHAAACWSYYFQQLHRYPINERVMELALKFMRHSSQVWRFWDFFQHIDLHRKYIQSTYVEAGNSTLHPLVWASFHGLESVVPTLLVRESDVNILQVHKFYGTPLHAAAMGEREEITRLLLAANIDPNIEGGQFRFALNAAVQVDNLRICKLLVEAGANLDMENNGETPLIDAARCSNIEICELLVEAGAEVNKYIDHRQLPTALDNAIHFGASYSICNILLQNGADIEGGSRIDNTKARPLQVASSYGYAGVCRSLLEHGADANSESPSMYRAYSFEKTSYPLPGDDANSELYRAYSCEKTSYPLHEACGRHIIYYGSGVDSGINSGVDHLQCIRLLLDAGANIHAKAGPFWSRGPKSPPIITLLESDYPYSNENRKNYLVEALNMLLEAGAAKGVEGSSLMSTLEDRCTMLEKEFGNVPLVKYTQDDGKRWGIRPNWQILRDRIQRYKYGIEQVLAYQKKEAQEP